MSTIITGKATVTGTYTTNTIYKINNICIINIDSNNAITNKGFNAVLFNIPSEFRPKVITPCVGAILNTNKAIPLRIHPDGNVINYSGEIINAALYINATYTI